jgi:hypothetical protein
MSGLKKEALNRIADVLEMDAIGRFSTSDLPDAHELYQFARDRVARRIRDDMAKAKAPPVRHMEFDMVFESPDRIKVGDTWWNLEVSGRRVWRRDGDGSVPHSSTRAMLEFIHEMAKQMVEKEDGRKEAGQ